jgi:hypothetical protein
MKQLQHEADVRANQLLRCEKEKYYAPQWYILQLFFLKIVDKMSKT